jgi:SpoIVB peptidase S55
MRLQLLAATALAVLVVAAPAGAAEPILPLSQVQPGMRCTGLTVVHGTDLASFDVDVLDVVDGDPVSQQPLLLIRVSGPVVQDTGIAEGFSGSPVICDGRIAGAVAYGSGDYGNQVGYATPIEELLGQPVPTPPGARPDPALRRARALRGPISVSGVAAAVLAPFATAGAKAGLQLVSVPAAPGPDRFPVQALQPGSSVAVGLSSGAITAGAVGTVTDVDGPRVYAFGHPYDATGARSLLLQDAWVYTVIANPLGIQDAVSRKLAAPGHDLGALTYDGRNGVTGLLGTLPPRIALTVHARNPRTAGARTDMAQVADETDVGLPDGVSPIRVIAPMALAQAGYVALDGTPAMQTASLCVRIRLRERARSAGFCNRYVGAFGGPNATPGGPYVDDLTSALADVDAFSAGTPHIASVDARLWIQPGLQQALLRSVSGPRTLRRGRTARLRLHLQRYRGARFTRTVRLRVARSAPLGRRTLRLTGTALDAGSGSGGDEVQIVLGGDGSERGGSGGPRSFAALAREIAALHADDGVRVRIGGGPARALYRDPQLRISGHASLRVRVTR